MSHIKGYVQFISEQNQGDKAAEIKRIQDVIKGLRNTSGNTQIKTIKRLEQELQDLKDQTFSDPIKIEPLTIPKPAVIISTEPAAANTAANTAVANSTTPAAANTAANTADANTAANPADAKPITPAVTKPATITVKKPVQTSSGRGNEALRARNIAKAKARKQNPTVNTKPTLNKAGTDSGSGVDALRQRMNKRSEERGK